MCRNRLKVSTKCRVGGQTDQLSPHEGTEAASVLGKAARSPTACPSMGQAYSVDWSRAATAPALAVQPPSEAVRCRHLASLGLSFFVCKMDDSVSYITGFSRGLQDTRTRRAEPGAA